MAAKKKKTKGFQPVKRPGAATRAAKREGISLHAWEEKHKHDKGRKGRQARFPLIAASWHHGKKSKSKKSSRKRVSVKA